MKVGEHLARALFEISGNPAEMHLSEAWLANIIDAAIEFADKTREEYDAIARQFEKQAKQLAGICAYGNCQNRVTGDHLYCDECRDNL